MPDSASSAPFPPETYALLLEESPKLAGWLKCSDCDRAGCRVQLLIVYRTNWPLDFLTSCLTFSTTANSYPSEMNRLPVDRDGQLGDDSVRFWFILIGLLQKRCSLLNV